MTHVERVARRLLPELFGYRTRRYSTVSTMDYFWEHADEAERAKALRLARELLAPIVEQAERLRERVAALCADASVLEAEPVTHRRRRPATRSEVAKWQCRLCKGEGTLGPNHEPCKPCRGTGWRKRRLSVQKVDRSPAASSRT